MFRGKAKPRRAKTRPTGDQMAHGKETAMAKSIDKLAKFEEFESEILPALQRDVKSGMTPKQLREKYQSIVQARLITEAIINPDANKAIAAGKDVIDRQEGKATEKKEVTHRFSEMSDNELDAIIASEEADLANMEERFDS